MGLSERERAVLDVERSWWLEGRSKTDVVHDRLALSLTRYNQLLSELIVRDDAEEYDPLLLRRLRRAREQGRWARMGVHPVSGRRTR
jgi:hypothetical protein